MIYLLIVYGIFAGYFAGFLGLGVGVFMMPFFMLLGIPYHLAVDASLMAVFLSSLTSGIQHFKTGKLALEPVIVMAVPGSICAIIGSFFLIQILSPVLLMIIFSGLLFLNADFFRFMREKKIESRPIAEINHLRYFPLYVITGIIVGFTASLLGVGGGIIIVPLLMRVARFEAREAVKIAVVVMIFTTLFGMLPSIIHNTMPYYIGGAVSIGAVIGCFLGSIALNYINQKLITHINYIVSLVLAIVMLFRAVLY